MNTLASTYGTIYLGQKDSSLEDLIDQLKPTSMLVLADSNTVKLCVPNLKTVVKEHPVVVIESGDQNKSLESCKAIWSAMIKTDLDRSALLLNIGGGMICDLGGFAASSFKRGIRFIHIPTSLLAMTDASIGGKTGVNFNGYKNLIGQFNLPEFTWIDTAFLKTLPVHELSDGLAEVIKHAVIGSPPLFDLLSSAKNISSLDWDQVIQLSAPVKQRIVDQDPLEKGIRKTLNFGHTVGHALESYYLRGPLPISHGKAVTLGMLAEARAAEQMGKLVQADFQRIISLIMRLLRPSEVTLPPLEALQQWLAGDKKKSNGIVGFSLPNGIGSCQWDIEVEDAYIEESLNWLTTHLKAFS